ncbi:hypothetical protein A2893_02660 [Candidatus Woesebacteria bacterium RIFCSPLOWO2_01_FULL_39_25]|uniref:DUF5659 domain-containing protein n=1 Tax=Candidatus Woesebacteria bacterium RIFCSPLOWO2_01_FULL_39_25 TaxID=1802521 RepID=A0A1F8BHT0_9BACT|nr:MAG: hypothetical protein A2893_02660 [Candidatus Woesebacteria bacterium RIFCSPLOWO2_01_FULL_39_25]
MIVWRPFFCWKKQNMSKINNNDLFETTDLHLASVLLSIGYTLEYIDKREPHKAVFVFNRNDKLENFVQAFWARALKLEPLSVLTSLKLIKNRLYSNEP